MKRNEIDKDLTWDLSSMFQSQEAYEEEYHKVLALLNEVANQKGHIADTKDVYLQFILKLEDLYRRVDNVCVYAQMATDVDPEDEDGQKNLSASSSLMQAVAEKLSFLDLEIIQKKDSIEQYLKEKDCEDFTYPMEEIWRTIPHRQSEEIEDIMAQYSGITRVPEESYSSFRMEFQPVHIDGKEEFLNGGTLNKFLLHPDSNVRKEAFQNYFQEYKRYQNLFINLLGGHAKTQVVNAKLRNFPSALEASLFEDGADKKLYDKVLYMANEKYHSYLHEYFALHKELLHLDTQHYYDTFLPMVKDIDITYSIDESFSILKKALAPLGEDYVEMLETARKERWIDFLPHPGKRSGAYSSGTHDSKPFILTNFTGSYDSLSTLAHELGHSMHSYYSHKHNRPILSSYRIFVAEVASTVNELLLNEYLLKTNDDKQYQAYLLDSLLTQLIGTLYRQPMYALLETKLHAWIEEGKPVSSKDLTQYFLDINHDYFGESVEVDELYRYACYHIPHFYYNFYVYKYTLGIAVAISFVKQILNGNVEEYRSFLTKGGSEAPIDELVHAGVDPRSDDVYNDAFTYFKEILDKFKRLMK